MKIKNILITVMTALSIATQAQTFRTIETNKGLTYKVYNADENSFGVASVLISGKEEAVLVDAQFTLADAEKVAQEIKTSGKKLKSIYVSHGDPDFYFGLQVFKKYFPETVVYATPSTVKHITETAQTKLDVWGGRLGNLITNNVVLPQVIKSNSIDLEGHAIEIIGLQDFPERTFLWIPSTKTVLGGINVFGTTFHLWVADNQTKESRNEWLKILQKIEALHPEIVIPVHAKSASDFNIKAVQHTEDYLKFYEEALKTNKTSGELINTLKKKYPTLTFEIALQLGAKVLTGEMKW